MPRDTFRYPLSMQPSIGIERPSQLLKSDTLKFQLRTTSSLNPSTMSL